MGYSIKTKKYHYVEWYYWDNINGERKEYVTSELYDNTIDPDENENVAASEQYAGTVASLAAQLKAGWKSALPPKK